MAAFDTTRSYAATGSARLIGSIFVTAFDTRPYGAPTAAGGLGSTIASLIGKVATWNDARLTRKSLGQLTDRELDDIGLVRGDINRVANR